MAAVARGKDRLGDRPRNADRRIVPGNADLTSRVLQVGTFVFDLRDRADHAESVSEALRDEDLFEVRRRQVDADPASECRRSAPDVYGNVEDLAFNDPDELSLWPAELQ